MVEAALNRFEAVDVLVNNAALTSQADHKRFEDITLSEWNEVMAVMSCPRPGSSA